jgi:hypothetical protein
MPIAPAVAAKRVIRQNEIRKREFKKPVAAACFFELNDIGRPVITEAPGLLTRFISESPAIRNLVSQRRSAFTSAKRYFPAILASKLTKKPHIELTAAYVYRLQSSRGACLYLN